MASGDYRKEDLLEENRTDSGIDSYRSILKEEPFPKAARDPGSDGSGPRDKFSAGEERLDSAYGSSSLTVESLSEIVEECNLSSREEESAQGTELSEQEENLLTTITEDGDTILHLAIIHEDEFFAHQLIQLFPKDVLDIQNNLYQTPLHLATYLNLPSVVHGLVEKGVSLELQDQDGNTALHVACQHGQTDCATQMTREVSPSKLAPVLETQNWRVTFHITNKMCTCRSYLSAHGDTEQASSPYQAPDEKGSRPEYPGRNQREDGSPPRRRAARHPGGDSAAQQRSQRGRGHV
ncbi:NF-kappa-B inhibitor epsilon isoform X2 [Centroberyx gerrardi]|uniref:NF-kappa-B inhibitor epsilon isoform X2 n=1 Tax=Centroberyx gerrardi TaxID=166262 RepID=UPI003AB10758